MKGQLLSDTDEVAAHADAGAVDLHQWHPGRGSAHGRCAVVLVHRADEERVHPSVE